MIVPAGCDRNAFFACWGGFPGLRGGLTQALGVTGEHDGVDLLGGGNMALHEDPAVSGQIMATPRIGISRATEREWRFVLRIDGGVGPQDR